MAQGQLLARHPGRVTDGGHQAQHHAADRGTAAVRLRDADHQNTAEAHSTTVTVAAPAARESSLTPPG